MNMPSAAFSYSKNYSAVDRYDRLCSKKSMVVLAMGLTKCGSIYCGTCAIWLLGMLGYYTRNVVNVKIPRAMIICLSGMSSLHNLLGAIHHEKKLLH